jgi:hypothetical protein
MPPVLHDLPVDGVGARLGDELSLALREGPPHAGKTRECGGRQGVRDGSSALVDEVGLFFFRCGSTGG